MPGLAEARVGKEPMGSARHVTVAAPSGDPASLAAAVREAFRQRIGADRFAVWFGDGAMVEVHPAGGRSGSVALTMRAGSGFAHEWLCRTFRGEFEAAARAACGAPVQVAWEPALPPPADEPPADASRRRSAIRERRPAAIAVSPAPTPPSVPAPGPRRAAPVLADFVVGASNRLASGAVEMVVARPGEISPLVIHGPSGVGKTHLLAGACARARELHPEIVTVYLSAEQFTTGFLDALRGGGLPGFRRTCRNADLFVIDDLQFFVGKRATIVELQATVDAVLRQGRQVVVGCDRELDALADLGNDLLARLRGGMNARIQPPDYEVRRGIVAAQCSRRTLEVPDDVIHHVAANMTRHARELLGAVNRLEATSQMLGVPITLDMAQEALSDLVRSSARSVRVADVEQAVCRAFGLEAGSLQSQRRVRNVSHPRMLAMYLARKHTHAALAEIGGYFGRRSHSTVIAAQKTVGEWVATRAEVVLAGVAWDVEEAIRRVEDLLRAG